MMNRRTNVKIPMNERIRMSVMNRRCKSLLKKTSCFPMSGSFLRRRTMTNCG